MCDWIVTIHILLRACSMSKGLHTLSPPSHPRNSKQQRDTTTPPPLDYPTPCSPLHKKTKDSATFMHLHVQQLQQFNRVPIACLLFFKPNLHHNDGFFPHNGRPVAQSSPQQLHSLIKTASRATACLASVHSTKDSRHSCLRNAAHSTTSTMTQRRSFYFSAVTKAIFYKDASIERMQALKDASVEVGCKCCRNVQLRRSLGRSKGFRQAFCKVAATSLFHAVRSA